MGGGKRVKQATFEQTHGAEWDALEQTLLALESGKRKTVRERLPEFAADYRRLVRQHALAVDRKYSLGLIDRLQVLLQRCHDQLYRRRDRLASATVRFFAVGFPCALRANARFFWIATALFYLPALAMGLWCFHQPLAIYSVVSAEQVETLEYMYDPTTEQIGRDADRQASTDFEMLGFYVWNNTGIGFRSFAGGLLFGIGSAVVTLFNGIFIGAAAGHLSGLGYHQVFWPFVAGHSAFELTAICISAAAGLMLGAALLVPGRRRRVESLRHAAVQTVPLISGAAVLFFAAALVEAFWSPSDTTTSVKYAVSAGLWLFLIAYLTLAGRGRRAA